MVVKILISQLKDVDKSMITKVSTINMIANFNTQ